MKIKVKRSTQIERMTEDMDEGVVLLGKLVFELDEIVKYRLVSYTKGERISRTDTVTRILRSLNVFLGGLDGLEREALDMKIVKIYAEKLTERVARLENAAEKNNENAGQNS